MFARESVALTLLAISFAPLVSFAEETTPLFDGKSLEGWTQQGGNAKYRVESGIIIGESVPNTPNSFLCTEKKYGDFVLEYEYKCDDRLNSGVQFRSNVFDEETEIELDGKQRKIAAGRVHGYQVEIDPNKPDRAWAGGIYDEGRRGWLYPGIRGGDADVFTKQGQKIYKPGEWNSVRVECNGNSIKTWLNGEPRADFTDDMTAEGFIALQVHGIGGNEAAAGTLVQWRNLTPRELK